MKRQPALWSLATTALAAVLCNQAVGSTWMFSPSYFSHEPLSGQRAVQFAQEAAAYRRDDPTYMQSGYRHNRSSLRGVAGSADHTHIVETWGLGEAIRPYGEWLFPFRAGATPFGPWGNPSGPWTSPFGSWMNPYGLGKLPHPPWPHWPVPYPPFGGQPAPAPQPRPGPGAP